MPGTFCIGLKPRRSRARQGFVIEQNAGRSLAKVRQPPHVLRLDVRSPRQKAAVHGMRNRPVARMESQSKHRLAPTPIPLARWPKTAGPASQFHLQEVACLVE